MKIKLTIIGLLLAGLFTGYLFVPTAAGDPPQQSCEVVSLGYVQYTERNADGIWVAVGTKVTWVNRTAGAPAIEPGTRLVDAIAILRNARYQKEPDVIYGESTFIR